MGFTQGGFGFGSNGNGGGGSGISGAENGLSVSGNNAVLGQDFGDLSNPAALTSGREIPFNGNFLIFTTADGANLALVETVDGSTQLTFVSNSNIQDTSAILMEDIADGSVSTIRHAAGELSLDNGLTDIRIRNADTHVIHLGSNRASAANIFINNNIGGDDNGSLLQIYGAASQTEHLPAISIIDFESVSVFKIRNDGSNGVIEGAGGGITINLTDGNVVFSGSIQTADPGSGANTWLLGDIQGGVTVAFDPTQYVETKIGGTTARLALVTIV